jgi:hypothetical protein
LQSAKSYSCATSSTVANPNTTSCKNSWVGRRNQGSRANRRARPDVPPAAQAQAKSLAIYPSPCRKVVVAPAASSTALAAQSAVLVPTAARRSLLAPVHT